MGLLSGLSWLLERLSITFTSKGKRELYHVIKFPLDLSFTVHYLVVSRNFLSIRIVLSFFYQPAGLEINGNPLTNGQ